MKRSISSRCPGWRASRSAREGISKSANSKPGATKQAASDHAPRERAACRQPGETTPRPPRRRRRLRPACERRVAFGKDQLDRPARQVHPRLLGAKRGATPRTPPPQKKMDNRQRAARAGVGRRDSHGEGPSGGSPETSRLPGARQTQASDDSRRPRSRDASRDVTPRSEMGQPGGVGRLEASGDRPVLRRRGGHGYRSTRVITHCDRFRCPPGNPSHQVFAAAPRDHPTP